MSVFIGVPTRGKIQASVSLFLAKQPHYVYFSNANISVETARLSVCKKFLDSKHTHLFFLDDDVLPPSDAVELLLEANKDVISANYPIISGGVIMSSACSGKDVLPFDGDGIIEITSCGLGACLIKREVIESIINKDCFNIEHDKLQIVTGEDTTFCNKVREAGYSIYYDFEIVCDHLKFVSLKNIYDRYVLSK
jgi:hypothetical protein